MLHFTEIQSRRANSTRKIIHRIYNKWYHDYYSGEVPESSHLQLCDSSQQHKEKWLISNDITRTLTCQVIVCKQIWLNNKHNKQNYIASSIFIGVFFLHSLVAAFWVVWSIFHPESCGIVKRRGWRDTLIPGGRVEIDCPIRKDGFLLALCGLDSIGHMPRPLITLIILCPLPNTGQQTCL